MKFLSFTTYHIDKLADIAKAADKLAANPPEGYKILAMYLYETRLSEPQNIE